MTTRIRKVITAIDVNGNAFSEQHTETQRLNGTWEQNDPTPLTDGSAWATQYNAALESANAQLVSAHKAEIDAKEAALTTANATIAALESRVASLLTELPFNPRIIDASAFYARVTKDEFATLSTSDDPQLGAIARAILAYKTNDWPVVFASTEVQNMLGYLVGVGFLTAERAAELTRDATREEAYDAA
tara:strand:- start:1770 stop:2336 length:567 start_codon:yes stop_codon:yes gene_type:complete